MAQGWADLLLEGFPPAGCAVRHGIGLPGLCGSPGARAEDVAPLLLGSDSLRHDRYQCKPGWQRAKWRCSPVS